MMLLLADHPSVSTGLVNQLARHTKLLDEAVDDLLLMSTERWLARRMLEVVGDQPAITISQEDLAQLSGVSGKGINRKLQPWEGRAYGKRGYGQVDITDRHVLESTIMGMDLR